MSSLFLHSLSRDGLINLALELQQKVVLYSKEIEDQLLYVAELEEGVQMLAEKVDAQGDIIKSQTDQISNLIAEKEQIDYLWKEKFSMMEKLYEQDSQKSLKRIALLEEENATYDQLIGEMEELLNSQESKILDLLAWKGTIEKEENAQFSVDANRSEYDNNVVGLSLLSKNTDDHHDSDIDDEEEEEEEEEVSPADLKISRDLSVRMGQFRRGGSQLIENTSTGDFSNSFVSVNKLFKPVNAMETREPESFIFSGVKRDIVNDNKDSKYNDHLPAPPMPPPSPLSKIGRYSFSRIKESPPLPLPPSISWKDAKRQHDNLFQPAAAANQNSESSDAPRIQYFQWYEGDD